VTGHAAGDSEPDLDWEALARPNHTVVVYMGASTAGRIADRLIAAGRAPGTPAMVVFRASRPDEVRCVTTLSALGEAAAAGSGPALLIVGEAMAEATALAPTDFLRQEERA
jgi:uroporphyrin-III C-methyltransferase